MNNDVISIGIIDNDEHSIKRLKEDISMFCDPKINILFTTTNAIVGQKKMFKYKPDLLFLEIELPDKNGFDLLKELRDKSDVDCYVVFYTNHERYTTDVLSRAGFDFILKPAKRVELYNMINHFLNHKEQSGFRDRIDKIVDDTQFFHNKNEMFESIESSTKVEYTKQKDGTTLKCTQTDENSDFEFLGDTYSISVLNCTSVVKIYAESYHEEVKLVKDQFNRLFIYAYREEMHFDSGKDRIDNKWSLVSSIQDADLVVKDNNTIWGRIPSVYLSEEGHVHVQEYIKTI